MANQSAEHTNSPDEGIVRGTGNVFADLGYADADERQTKLSLAYAINSVITRQRLTQAGAAEKLGVNQPKVSALANYRLNGFSVERLMTFRPRSTRMWRSSSRRSRDRGQMRGFWSWLHRLAIRSQRLTISQARSPCAPPRMAARFRASHSTVQTLSVAMAGAVSRTLEASVSSRLCSRFLWDWIGR